MLIVEVLSPSNADIARQNVSAYATIPSVEEIALLGGTRIVAEVYRRGPGRERAREAMVVRGGETLEFATIGLAAPLRDLHRATSLAGA